MVPLINKRENFKTNYIREFYESERLQQWLRMSDLGSEKVNILMTRFCKVVTHSPGFR